MGVEVKTVIMVGVNIPMDRFDEEDMYDELDGYSSFEKGNITYLYDGMQGNYFYVGEVLFYDEDAFNGSVFELDNSEIEDIKLQVQQFILKRFGFIEIPKVTFINHVY